ncbi:deoxyhypusine hydroxylase [Sorochytrium milnesiophthora]
MAVDYEFPSTAVEQARDNPETYAALAAVLHNKSGSVAMTERFRALFTLKALQTPQAIDIIGQAFVDPSALLKHELAYVLGQMKNPYAVAILLRVLGDRDEDAMVRHEAAEALGAIGTSTSDADMLALLERFRDDATEPAVVRETCELAVDRIRWEQQRQHALATGAATEQLGESPFTSVDPAPPLPIEEQTNVPDLRAILMDPRRSLFHRYRAMFSLRNIGSEEAVLALAEGFKDSSALFRHEIAYVFGQLQHPASVPSLIAVLEDVSEVGMVRHEAAEALGSVGTPECLPVLQRFAQHDDQPQKPAVEDVVRESCQVGVDMWEYENGDQLQYADGLGKV